MGRAGALVPAAAAAALVFAAATSSSPSPVKDGGTFRVAVYGDYFGGIDPVLAQATSLPLLRATCAGLMTTPDRPLPDGLRIVPEIASGFPKITNGGRTYTFTIRQGVRFSDGTPVTARSFAWTINRTLDPGMKAPDAASVFADIVGARAVIAGKRARATGIVVRGRTLTFNLTRPAGDFLARLTSAGGFCVVPENLPVDPEGVKAPLPSAGPYYASEYHPGQRVVLERNRFYRGQRPHHVDRIVGDLTPLSGGGDNAAMLDRVERGELDYALVPVPFGDRAVGYMRRYGINKSRLFVVPSTNIRMFVLNTEGRLFRNNPKLRQAVNLAIDRSAIVREDGPHSGTPTDQYLPFGLPGFRDEHVYPLQSPNIARARKLAKGHLRGGRAVLYTVKNATNVAQAQILRANLARIGLQVEIKPFASQSLQEKLATRGEPFDIARARWVVYQPDPGILNDLFDGRTIGRPGNINWSYFSSAKYNALLDAASRLPVGAKRSRVYGALDVDIARNAAPAIAVSYDNALTFVSKRTGCVIANPFLDLAAVCLKE